MSFRRFFNPVSLVLYVFLYVLYDIVIVISSRNNTSFSFHPIVVIFSAELLKFLVSLVLFAFEWCTHRNTAQLVVPSDALAIALGLSIKKTLSQQPGAYEAVVAQKIHQIEFERHGIDLVGAQSLLPGDNFVAVQSGDGAPPTKIPALKQTDNDFFLDTLIGEHCNRGSGTVTLHFTRHFNRSVWLKTLGLFGVAVLYTVWNILNYEALLRVKLSQYSIIYQINIVFVVLLWTVIFRRKFSLLQWTAIAVLISGCVLIRIGKGYFITWSWTLIYVIAQAFVSAVAGVVNEFLYKDGELSKLSLNLQNAFLYGYSVLCCAVYAFVLHWLHPSEYHLAELAAESIQAKPLALSLIAMAIGLNTSYILRNLSNISKIFATAVHSPIEIIAAHFIIGTKLSLLIVLASLLIMAAIVLFKAQDVVFLLCKACPKRNFCAFNISLCPKCRKDATVCKSGERAGLDDAVEEDTKTVFLNLGQHHR